MILAKAGIGIQFNEHMEGDGPNRGNLLFIRVSIENSWRFV